MAHKRIPWGHSLTLGSHAANQQECADEQGAELHDLEDSLTDAQKHLVHIPIELVRGCTIGHALNRIVE